MHARRECDIETIKNNQSNTPLFQRTHVTCRKRVHRQQLKYQTRYPYNSHIAVEKQ